MRYFVILCVMAVVIGGTYWRPYFNDFNISISNAQPPHTSYSAVVMVGDVMLGRAVETLIDKHGSDYPYRRLTKMFDPQTAIIGNFEAAIPVTHNKTPDYTFRFSVDSEHIPDLRKVGFTHMSLANNHSNDYGEEGRQNTVSSLKKQHIVPLQSYVNASSTIIHIDNYSLGITTLSTVNSNVVLEKLSTDFYHLSAQTDMQIAYIHWGEEYQTVHSADQQKLAESLIELGYDAIVGHHPHVVQDIAWYQGNPIFYSLGNFIFDQYFSDDVSTGLVITMDIKSGAVTYDLDGVTSLDSPSQPRPLNQSEKTSFLDTLANNSADELFEQITNGKITQHLK